MKRRVARGLAATALALAGCTVLDVERNVPIGIGQPAELTPSAESRRDLKNLPAPKGPIVASVYGFRDQTGQYKPAPDSSFSTAVTQGAGAMLVKALMDSQWFIPVEREGLQNLLTERRIVRALDTPGAPPSNNLTGLLPASVLMEGGIIAYENNVRTGGLGAKYMGIGASDQYRTDQVTINLRAVDIRTGRILGSVSTTKSVYSFKVGADVFRYVAFQELLEAEVGFTRNEPAQLCVMNAIETALIHLIVDGIRDNHWALKNPQDFQSPLIQRYLAAQQKALLAPQPSQAVAKDGPFPESSTF